MLAIGISQLNPAMANEQDSNDSWFAFPPINWSAKTGYMYRQVIQETGEDIIQESRTGEIAGRSYVWQPWFGNWTGRLSGSWANREASDNSENIVLSGEADINLFHLSRFPFTAFVDVRDSRADFDDPVDPGTEERFMQYGIRQSYTPASGGGSVNLNLLRDEREDFITGDQEESNRIITSGFLHRGHHSFNSSIIAYETNRSINSEEQFFWQADLSHTFTPSSQFTITSNAGAGSNESHGDTNDSQSEQIRLGTNFHWRDANRPLSLRGDVAISSLQKDDSLSGDTDQQQSRGTLALQYLPNDYWRLSADAGFRNLTGDEQNLSTFQGFSADYSSPIIPLAEFNYSYGAGAGLRNETNSETEGTQVYQTNVSHNLSRVWLLDWGVPISSSFNAGQTFSFEDGADDGSASSVVSNLSYSLNFTGANHSTSFNAIAYDSRNYGRNDLSSQTISLNGIHNHRLSRYSDFSVSYNFNYSQQEGSDNKDSSLDEQDSSNDGASNLDAVYRNSRLFNVRNLIFKSRFRASADDLLLSNLSSSQDSELFWENRLDYNIGKLDVNFRATWQDKPGADEGGSMTFVLAVSRYF